LNSRTTRKSDSMKPFSQLSKELNQELNPLTEASKSKRPVTAPALEKKLTPLLKEPGIGKEATRYIKAVLKNSKKENGTFYPSDMVNVVVSTAKEKIKDDQKDAVNNKALKEMKPITICDILSEPQPKMFIELMKSGSDEIIAMALRKTLGRVVNNFDLPSWADNLEKYSKVMGDWLEQEGGAKAAIIPKIVEMQACSKKAGWARWSGKAYRGVERTVDRLKQYKYTGEITTLEGFGGKELYLVSTVKYKSRYAVQSWTPKLKVAREFASGHGKADGSRSYGVVMEIDITDKESFLSPEIVNSISSYKESEVLRVSDKPTTVTAYVSWKNLGRFLESKLIRGGLKVGDDAGNMKKIQAALADIVGTSAAKTLMGKAEIKKWIDKMMKGR
jgi:hypothetical protein